MKRKKRLIKQLDDITALYRDDRTGIAWVENGHTGSHHSSHPNIDATGSVIGMKNLGYWRYNAIVKRCHGAIYNISVCSVQDSYDELARQHCRCGGFCEIHGEQDKTCQIYTSYSLG